MSNLNDLAFPLFEPGGTDGSIARGYTKHEYAALLLAHGLLTNYGSSPTLDERDQIAGIAYELAQHVLSYFK